MSAIANLDRSAIERIVREVVLSKVVPQADAKSAAGSPETSAPASGGTGSWS